jgi:hypothetical protein
MMKKFLFLYHGYTTLTPEIRQAWIDWFASVGDVFVDSGNPFGSGREVTHAGTIDLPQDSNAITGYSLINAANMAEAESIAKSCPFVSSIKVYEALSM